jgi:hypothetical protein
MKAHLAAKLLTLALVCLGVPFFTGCQTTRSEDWNGRIGKCTLNQAVAELGTPNKETKFSDGKIAAQWITLHGSDDLSMGGGPAHGRQDMGYAPDMTQNYRDHVLELTFGPDGKLVSVAKNY